MSKPFIFVSCGQFTAAEKLLGAAIVKVVESTTELDAFFAEEVQDLDGLNNNILGALRDCAALIVVLHPRGEVNRPDKSKHVRASVWIEQEIAIAAYIRSVEKRPLPVMAFRHESVGREGIRDLLHLNPIKFTDESEVLAALPGLLAPWKTLAPTGIQIQLTSEQMGYQDGHPIRRLNVNLVNGTNERITTYDGLVRVPINILKHWSQHYWHEEQSDDPACRQFRLSEKNTGPILPRKTVNLYRVDYCMKCGVDAAGGVDAVITNATALARVWIDNRAYEQEKTMLALRPDNEP